MPNLTRNTKGNKMETLKIKENKRGIKYALCKNNSGYVVYKLCENYCSTAKKGIAKTWRYVQKDLDETTAIILFNKRSA
jgi:hypothetical protein